MARGEIWTAQELSRLATMYSHYPNEVLAEYFPGRNPVSIQRVGSRHGWKKTSAALSAAKRLGRNKIPKVTKGIGQPPVCECGCGELVELGKRRPLHWNRFVIGHQSRGRRHGEETRQKIAAARQEYSSVRSSNWKGGRRVNSNGYVEVHMPNHPRARGNGYVFEHILVLEQKLGRPIKPDEVVHHHDRNKQNNDPDNLMLTTSSEHRRLHREDKPLTGVMKVCEVCGDSFYVKPSHLKIRRTCSYNCAGTLGNRTRFGRCAPA